MECDRWERIKALFEQAAELSPAGRQACLDVACADDTQLRREIDALLGSHDSSGVLDLSLADFAGVLPPSDIRPAFSNQQVVSERFRILRFLGRGGMGEVYEAEDLVLGGSVALKTLRPEFVTETHLVRRFRREVQLARKVTHPNVCRVFDVGVHSTGNTEIAYLTMEFLEGETLAAVLRRRGRHSPEEALPIVRQICYGLDALHSAKIVHRDLKPGNIILVPKPEGPPKAVLTDFGLAQVADAGKAQATATSRASGLFGTPEYMAPEQLTGGEVDAATDIYSLGLVLYELVSGEKLFAGAGLAGAIRRVTDKAALPQEPAQGVDKRWFAVVCQCASPSAAERPSSPADVLALLESKTALRPRSQNRARWWLRVAAALAAVLTLALLGMFLRNIAWEGGDGQQEPVQRRVAVLPFHAADGDAGLQAFADGLMEAVASRLSQFEGLNAELLVTPASEVRRQQANDAGDAHRKLGVDYAVEGSIYSQGDRVRLVLTLIDAANMQQLDSSIVEDQRVNALNLQDGAVSQLANLLDLRIQPEHAADWANSSPITPGAHEFYLQGRGYVQRSDRLDSIDNAITLFRRALELDGRHAPSYAGLCEAYWYRYERTSEPKWVSEASANCERALQINGQLAEAHVTMGRLRNGTGEYRQAVTEFETALRIEPRNAEAFQGLGLAYDRMGRHADAEATYHKAVALRPGDWTMYKQLGLFYYRQGQYQNAINTYEQVVALTPDNAHGYANLGSFYYRLNDLAQAERFWRLALTIDPQRPSLLNNLAKLALDQGAEAQAIQHWEAIQPEKRTEQIWSNLGASYLVIGDSAKSERAYREAIRFASAQLAINPNLPAVVARLGHYLAEIGDHREAVRLTDKALAAEPSDPDVVARAAYTFAAVGHFERAFELAVHALELGYSPAAMSRSPSIKNMLIKHPAYRDRLEDAEKLVTSGIAKGTSDE